MPPTFVQEVNDVSLVVNSSDVRSGADLGLVSFNCTIDSQPLANIEWSYVNNSRVSIQTDRQGLVRQLSTLRISSVEFGDKGVFTCSAMSPVGSNSSSGNLSVFGKFF